MSQVESKRQRPDEDTASGTAPVAPAGFAKALWPGVLLCSISAVMAFTLSFDALRAVGRASGVSPSLSWMFPCTIDVVILFATWAAWRFRARGAGAGWYAWALLAVFAATSYVGNFLHAHPVRVGDLTLSPVAASLFSSVPSVSLLLTTHMLVLIAVHRGQERQAATVTPTPAARVVTASVAGPATGPVVSQQGGEGQTRPVSGTTPPGWPAPARDVARPTAPARPATPAPSGRPTPAVPAPAVATPAAPASTAPVPGTPAPATRAQVDRAAMGGTARPTVDNGPRPDADVRPAVSHARPSAPVGEIGTVRGALATAPQRTPDQGLTGASRGHLHAVRADERPAPTIVPTLTSASVPAPAPSSSGVQGDDLDRLTAWVRQRVAAGLPPSGAAAFRDGLAPSESTAKRRLAALRAAVPDLFTTVEG